MDRRNAPHRGRARRALARRRRRVFQRRRTLRTGGVAMGFDAARSYGDLAELLDREKQRPDGTEAVAIMTPNDTHYPYAVAALDAGLDVVGDKPVTHDAAQARDLVARAAEERQDLRDRPRLFRVSDDPLCARIWSATARSARCAWSRSNTSRAAWRRASRTVRRATGSRWILDPQRSGLSLVMSAIGCHAQHLACFDVRPRRSRASPPTPARWCPAARSSITRRR